MMLAALQDQPLRPFSKRSKLKAKIRIRRPFFLKKNQEEDRIL